MPATLRILDANATLANHEAALRQAENLSFRLLSLTIGRENANPANLVTLLQSRAGPPPSPINLETIGGDLDQTAQEARLNTGDRVLVCYGSLYVGGRECNVAAYRKT